MIGMLFPPVAICTKAVVNGIGNAVDDVGDINLNPLDGSGQIDNMVIGPDGGAATLTPYSTADGKEIFQRVNKNGNLYGSYYFVNDKIPKNP